MKLLTNILTPRSYGEFALAMTVVGGMGTLMYGPLSQVGLRFASVASTRGVGHEFLAWLRASYARTVAGTTCTALAVFVLLALYGNWQWAALTAGAVCLGFGVGAITIVIAVLNGLRLRPQMAVVQTVDALARPAIIVLALMTVWRSSEIAVAAAAMAVWLVVLVSYRHFERITIVTGRDNTVVSGTGAVEALRQDMLRYLLPFVLFGVVSLVGLYGDRWVIQTIAGPEDVGMYAVMYQIASAPVVIVLGLVNQFAYPIVFAREGDKSTVGAQRNKSYRLMLIVSGLLIALIAAGAYLFGESVLLALTAGNFTQHHNALWILVVGLSVFHFAQQMTVLGLSARRPSVYVWPKAAHSVVFLALAVPLGTKFGIEGVAIAFVAASVAYLALIFQANRTLAAPSSRAAGDGTGGERNHRAVEP